MTAVTRTARVPGARYLESTSLLTALAPRLNLRTPGNREMTTRTVMLATQLASTGPDSRLVRNDVPTS